MSKYNLEKILSPELLNQYHVCDFGYTNLGEAKSLEYYQNWIINAHNDSQHIPDWLKSQEAQQKRQSLQAWWPEAQSAVVFLFDYAKVVKYLREKKFTQVAAYTLAYEGADYHIVLQEALCQLGEKLKAHFGESHDRFAYKISLDTQPILERDLAYRAGLGWFGKNSMLIHREWGSYFLIGSLILNKDLSALKMYETSDQRELTFETDHCGHCRACIEACPTKALDEASRTLKWNLCLSSWSIENRKGEIAPPLGLEKSRDEIFGCDICQDVCPWNKKRLTSVLECLPINTQWLNFFNQSLENLFSFISKNSRRSLDKFFQGTPFIRPSKQGWLNTLEVRLRLKNKN
jgi:epoxyqueuosine reductase